MTALETEIKKLVDKIEESIIAGKFVKTKQDEYTIDVNIDDIHAEMWNVNNPADTSVYVIRIKDIDLRLFDSELKKLKEPERIREIIRMKSDEEKRREREKLLSNRADIEAQLRELDAEFENEMNMNTGE